MGKTRTGLRRLHGGRLALVFIGILLLYLLALVVRIHLAGGRDERGEAEVIIVLGAAQLNGRPSPILRERLEHGLTLYRSGNGRYLLFTGGRQPGDPFTEAGVGRSYALARGVPAESILLEDEGRTTMQSLQRCRDMMRQRGLHRAILVSDPFHAFRLRRMARDLGMHALVSPTPTSRVRSRMVKLRYELREVATYVIYRFFGI